MSDLGQQLAAERLRRERRERIATAVVAGFAACPYKPGTKNEDVAAIMAEAAVEVADALIAQLDKA